MGGVRDVNTVLSTFSKHAFYDSCDVFLVGKHHERARLLIVSVSRPSQSVQQLWLSTARRTNEAQANECFKKKSTIC